MASSSSTFAHLIREQNLCQVTGVSYIRIFQGNFWEAIMSVGFGGSQMQGSNPDTVWTWSHYLSWAWNENVHTISFLHRYCEDEREWKEQRLLGSPGPSPLREARKGSLMCWSMQLSDEGVSLPSFSPNQTSRRHRWRRENIHSTQNTGLGLKSGSHRLLGLLELRGNSH